MKKIKVEEKYKRYLSPWLFASHVATLFWYVALFPGRIGADPIKAIDLMRQGESTDWWSALYWWFLKLTTFNGTSIWLSSLLSLLPLYLSLLYFIFSLPVRPSVQDKSVFLICLSPLFGNFGVNINHDTFVTSGAFLIVGISFREFSKVRKNSNVLIPYIAVFFLLNSKTGYFLICGFLGYILLTKKGFWNFAKIASFTLSLFLATCLGVTKSDMPLQLYPILADIKCVTQHPEARINQNEWKYLSSIAELSLWKTPLSCASMDDAVSTIKSANFLEINEAKLLKTYIGIFGRNPAIVIQAHLQRSSQALPPPFFQGPQNHVDRDIQNPVGLNTNIALQLGPEVLHPSIDDPTLNSRNSPFPPLEKIALLSSFLINQASWFWGWGGLWLWPILMVQVTVFKVRKPSTFLALNYPLILNHLLHIAVGPIPAPRYVMSTILIGYSLLVLVLVKWWEKNHRKEGFEI